MADWADDPDIRAWLDNAQKTLLPMIRKSAMTMTLITGSDPDAKMAVELGMSILLNKPIVAIRKPGAVIPEKLAQVLDYDLQVDLDDPGAQQVVHDFFDSDDFKTIMEQYGG